MISADVNSWFLSCSDRIVESLSQPCRAILQALATGSRLRHVDEGAIVLFIAQQYARGWSPDKLVDHLIEMEFCRDGLAKAEQLREFVCSIRTAYCSCQLALPKYWDPETPFRDFLTYDAALRIEAGEEVSSIADTFRAKWAFREPQLIIDEGAERLKIEPAVIAQELAWVEQFATSIGLGESLSKQFELLSSAFSAVQSNYPYLMSMLKAIAGLQLLQESDNQAAKTAGSELGTRLKQLLDWSNKLFCWERGFFVSKDTLQAKLERSLELVPIVRFESPPISSGVFIGVPAERLNGEDYIPHWLQEAVFTNGGRFMHNSLGPVPYLFVVLEPDESYAAGTQVGIAEPTITDTEVMLTFVLNDGDDPINFDYHFLVEKAESLRTLILITILQSFRFSILISDQRGKLSIANSGLICLDSDYIEKLSTACDVALMEHFGGRPETLRDAMASSREDPLYGFLMMEHAKIERLLVDTGTLPTSPDELTEALWQDFSKLRSTRLGLEDSRVRALDEELEGHAAVIAREIEEVSQRYRRVLQQLRGRDHDAFEQFSGKAQFSDLLQVLEHSNRCFVHIGLKSNQLVACFAYLRNNNAAVEMVTFPNFVLEDVIDTTNIWLAACDGDDSTEEKNALDKLLAELGKSIGEPLTVALTAANIRDVVICPSWFLELIPLHCMPTDSSEKLLFLDRFRSVTYAPSLKLLYRNRKSPNALASNVIAFSPSDSPLPWADAEAGVVSRTLDCAAKASGADATPERWTEMASASNILHVACHGLWDPVDPFRSSLILSGVDAASCNLTAATIMRGNRLDNLSLITLSACHSGTHLQKIHTFQEYRGIDGTLLAMGAHVVVSTLWSVGDLSALLVSARFYHELKRGQSPDASLHAATQQLRNGYLDNMPDDTSLGDMLDELAFGWRAETAIFSDEFRHPSSWGAFRCNGAAWHPIQIKPKCT